MRGIVISIKFVSFSFSKTNMVNIYFEIIICLNFLTNTALWLKIKKWFKLVLRVLWLEPNNLRKDTMVGEAKR